MQEIIIRISPEIDREISPKISREIFKPILTKEQEVELVEKCLRLKAANVRGFNLQGIKWFYEKYFPKEFHGHNTNKDWDKCHLSSRKLVRLTKAFNEKNLILPQTFQEVQHSKELSEFTNERLFIPEISKKQKDEIINKSIFLAKTSKTPHIKTIKWFYRTYHYEYYKQYEKFNLWDNTGLRRKIVHMWVRRKKIEMAKKNQNKTHAQKFPTENIRLVEDIKEEIKHEPEVNIETVTYGESYEEKVEINVDESDQVV